MTQRMLIDATQPEETRVVVHKGDRIEDFDYETAIKKQLKGNIYLAKVTRVEPSLQAAFVEYGGNRHGFLPFSEIHPDYYRIPIADREALMAAEKAALRAEDDDEAVGDDNDDENGNGEDSGRSGARKRGGRRRGGRGRAARAKAPEALQEDPGQSDETAGETAVADEAEAAARGDVSPDDDGQAEESRGEEGRGLEGRGMESRSDDGDDGESDGLAPVDGDIPPALEIAPALDDEIDAPADLREVEAEAKVDSIGDDEVADAEERRAQLLRRYKIQEVIKRRQIILVQVTKEERGNKGAALTTYLSLAGRYCVLMPNTNKGGGISRKISNTSDRRRLKKILAELKIPDGIAVIVRTAGSQRSKAEIRRDYEYLMRLWNEIRETTLQSTAPALIHEEANLIKRAIRDLYNRDMDEILVEGEDGYKAAKAFMKSLMPSHAKKVQLYKDEVPLYQRYRVERHLDAMHLPTVQLRSGGYIVLNATEALVAIDVNSGKATRERNIEETALKTNLEAAEEVGRQLRLRDLAGLVVIDFIDMEDQRHNREVERKLKEALRHDRARIQLGRISPFGLLEMSRQRLRPSLFESSTAMCPHCNGTGHVRTPESAALQILRNLEEEGLRNRGGELTVTAPTDVALYLLNQKRANLSHIEERYGLSVQVQADNHISTAEMKLERAGAQGEGARSSTIIGEEAPDSGAGRRRGRRRGRWSDSQAEAAEADSSADDEAQAAAPGPDEDDGGQAAEARGSDSPGGEDDERPKKRRRRGKRGGRRRSRRSDEAGSSESGEPDAESGADGDGSQGEPQEIAAQSDDGEAAAAESATEEAAPEDGTTAEARGAAEGSAAEGGATEGSAAEDDGAKAEGSSGRSRRRRGTGRDRRPRKAKAGSEAQSEAEAQSGDEAAASANGESAARPTEEAVTEEAVAEEVVTEEAMAEVPAAATNGSATPHVEPATSAVSPQDGDLALEQRLAEEVPAENGAMEEAAAPETVAPETVAVETIPDGPPRPKKRGWWNKLLDS